MEYTGDNEYDLPQEQRPQTRRESNLDAHFQQRVRKKQSRYRDILKGDAEIEPDSNNRNRPLQNQHGKDGGNGNGNCNLDAVEEDDEDSILLAAKNADSYSDVHSARIHVQSSKTNQIARRNRKERIGGFTDASTARKSALSSASASDAETARSLRAQRLRVTLLKQTPDEYDVQTKLELRRLAHKEEEAFARKSERVSTDGNSNSNSPSRSINTSKAQERMAMEAERKALQAEREALAIAKEEAALALMRAAELNEERIRQRELDARLEADRLEEERLTKRRERAKEEAQSKQQQKEQLQQNSYYSTSKKNTNRKLKTKNFMSCSISTNTDGDTLMTEFDAENDFAFLSDLSGIVRDTGFLKSCGACFGDAGAGVVEDADEKEMVLFTGASSNISSVFVPDLVPSSDHSGSDDDRTTDSIRRSRVYAKYRA